MLKKLMEKILPHYREKRILSEKKLLNARYYERHSLANFLGARIVDLKGELIGNVKNISYSGLGVLAVKAIEKEITPFHDIELKILDLSIKMRMKLVFKKDTVLGCSIIHDTPETLLALRPIIENSQRGKSLIEISKENVHLLMQKKYTHVYRGDGPTDLLFKYDPHQHLIESLIFTTRQGDKYYDLRFEVGQWKTSRSSASDLLNSNLSGVAPRMENDLKFDEKILRDFIFVVLGSENLLLYKMMEPLIRNGVNLLIPLRLAV